MTRTFMIRHAKPRSRWGVDDDPDPGLDAIGREQAERAADALMALGEAVRPRRVFASPLARCRETAEPFARRIGAEVEIDPRFGEIPSPAGLTSAERGAWLLAAFGVNWSQIKGGLDYDGWRRTVGQAVVDRAGCALFSHFVAINAAVSCALASDAVMNVNPDHASVTVFDVDAGRLALLERGRQAETEIL